MADRTPDPGPATGLPSAMLLAVCGWVGIGGVVVVILTNLVGGIVVPDYDLIADTISDLAAGKYEIIQDVGLYAFAGSLAACALGSANAHPGGRRWSFGVVALALMAALVVVIGARNEYGDGDQTATWGVHLGMVFVLMLLFLATTVLMAPGLGAVRTIYRRGSLICTAMFVVAGVGYFFAPTGYDGAVERGVALVALGWTAMVSCLLLEVRGRVAG